MVSPWQMPLPIGEFATTPVIVYFYSEQYTNKWVPLKYCHLEKAILLHKNTLLSGQEVLLFPPDLDPNSF